LPKLLKISSLNDAVEAEGGYAELAASWYRNAAQYFTTYYGQLASQKVNNGVGLRLPAAPDITAEEATRFNAHELVAASRALAEVNAKDWIRPLILQLFSLDTSLEWAVQTASLARELGRPDLAVRVAKLAERRGQYIPDAGYPVLIPPGLPKSADGDGVERAMVLAVIRQESAFYPVARSGAGAMGMMQIMPATARRVAKQVGMHYTKAKLLDDPDFNMQLGQSYLSSVLKSFGGDKVNEGW